MFIATKHNVRDRNVETSAIHREVAEALKEYHFACDEEIFDKTIDITFDDFIPTAMLYEVYRRYVTTKVGTHWSESILDLSDFGVIVREVFAIGETRNTIRRGERGILGMRGPIIVIPKQESFSPVAKIPGTRVCRVCKRRLARDSFVKRYGKQQGIQSYCKDCRNEQQRFYRHNKKQESK